MGEVLTVTTGGDLVDAIREVLRQSDEPLTIPRIRRALPAPFHAIGLEELADVIHRQVGADVLVMCPKYRSAQDRFWDRPLRGHARTILRDALRAGPMTWSHLRKRFPKYLRYLADSVLNEELARGSIFRHPPISPRGGPRYALHPADVRPYAATELRDLLNRLRTAGFDPTETRDALVQLLQDDEWTETESGGRPADAELCDIPMY